MSDREASPLSGIEQLRHMIATDAQPPMGRTFGVSLVEVGEGRAVFEGVPDERSLNPLGTIHGGYAATMLDSACGVAVHTRLEPGQGYTTLELKVAYHRAMTTATGKVRAIGTVVSFGRRVAFAEAKILDSQDRLIASATSTLLVFAQ